MEKYYTEHLNFFPLITLKLTILFLMLFIGLFFIKEGKHRTSLMGIYYCGIGFWIINLIIFGIIVLFSLLNKEMLMKKYKILCKVHAIYKPIITVRLDRKSINQLLIFGFYVIYNYIFFNKKK